MLKSTLVKDVGDNTLWVSNGSGVLSSVRAGIGGADRLGNSFLQLQLLWEVQY